MSSTCPITETVAGYLLRCVMPAGHDGEHWAAELEEVEAT